MKTTADVSIIAANFNNGRFLTAFIESIVNSTVLPKQLIIIDDGSTDNSAEIYTKYQVLDFLSIIRFDRNCGLCTALNAGLDAAQGRYIMRADPDDILMPERIEKQYHYMQNHPEIDVLGCNVSYFRDDDGSRINNSNFPLHHTEIETVYHKGEHGIQHPTAFIKAEVYCKFRYQPIFPGEDYELFARMINDGYKFANLAESLYLMRVHQGSSTTNLKLRAIRQTFTFRDKIFGTKTKKWRILSYYLHVRHYRNYQISDNIIMKYLHLLIAMIAYPEKVIKRIKR